MPRPADLPDFGAPPLNELVLGVQFAPIPTYTTVDAGEIWELFRSDFPIVREQPPLPPLFETFGGGPSPGVQFQLGPAIGPTRLWFIAERGNHLLQFQPDRLLLNWRQNGDGAYPRYEVIAKSFQNYLGKLDDHVHETKSYQLEINQIEISYINIIPIEDLSEQVNWLNIAPNIDFPIEQLTTNFSEIMQNQDGKSIARLHHNLLSVVSMDGRSKAVQLDLTYRGKPSHAGIVAAFELLEKGRAAIVKRFAELTTKSAHEAWKRTS